MKPIYLFTIIICLTNACKLLSSGTFGDIYELGNGNRIVSKYKNTHLSSGKDIVIMEGKNNNIEVIYENVNVSGSKNIPDLIIFKGSNNHIMYQISNLEDIIHENGKRDTIIIDLGNHRNVEVNYEKGKYQSRNLKTDKNARKNMRKQKDLEKKNMNKKETKTEKQVKANQKINQDTLKINNLEDIKIGYSPITDSIFIKQYADTLINRKDTANYIIKDTNALIYYEKIGKNLKISEVVKIIKVDADKREPEALYLLANLYFNAIGLERNTKKAMKLYELAAQKNYIPAQFNLGGIYEEGMIDIPQDTSKAIFYYKMAARNGMQEAKVKLKELEK